jgi:hypothetical protein
MADSSINDMDNPGSKPFCPTPATQEHVTTSPRADQKEVAWIIEFVLAQWQLGRACSAAAADACRAPAGCLRQKPA